jgi:hypothetical protein
MPTAAITGDREQPNLFVADAADEAIPVQLRVKSCVLTCGSS